MLIVKAVLENTFLTNIIIKYFTKESVRESKRIILRMDFLSKQAGSVKKADITIKTFTYYSFAYNQRRKERGGGCSFRNKL